jgi:hypothetical protein
MGSTGVCERCVQKRSQTILADISRSSFPEGTAELARHCIRNLYPFRDPDCDLIEILADTVKKGDDAAFKAVVGTSEMIGEIRTCQAYNSRSLLPIREVPRLLDGVSKVLPDTAEIELRQISEVVNAPLVFSFEATTSPKDFFAIANEHRASLAQIVDDVVQLATQDGEIMLSRLSNRLAELNAELHSLRTNRRYLGYKAAFGFLRANTVLLASSLVAGALGLAGNFVGCGVSVASGVGAKYGIRMLRQAGRLRASPETTAFLAQLKASLRPMLHRLLASYAGVSLPAIQIHELSEDVEQRLPRVPARSLSSPAVK